MIASTQMKVISGLRMFMRPGKGAFEENVFYSQRRHGPIYRWRYENHVAKWYGQRVDASNWSSQECCSASWKSVPQELKTQLSEHYVE